MQTHKQKDNVTTTATEKTYTVSIAVDARCYVTVRATDPEAAKEKATVAVQDADFGELECIDWSFVNAEWTDKDGKYYLVDY